MSSIEALELEAYGAGAAPLVRLSLLKRMDSSAAAFRTSLLRLRESLAAVLSAAVAGRVLRPGRHRASGDRDPFQLVMVGLVADPAPPDLDLDAWIETARRDLRHVDGLLARSGATGRERGPATDPRAACSPVQGPKTESLRALLRELHGEQVLVFTEYRDTAAFLWRALLRDHRVGRIDGSGAWLGPSPAGRRHVVERFAPRANHRPLPPERERVDVLIATDVLAEGLNLQDARHVVSYDLPWNPVRLIQRIGRVDRLGSPHENVVPHLFLPAEGLDRVLGLTRSLRTKLYGIATALGGAQADELLAGLVTGSADRVADVLDCIERRQDVDPWERVRTLWVRGEAFGAGPVSSSRASTAPASDDQPATFPAARSGSTMSPASESGSDSVAIPPAAWYSEVPARHVAGADLDALVLVCPGAWDRARLIELSTDGRAGPLTVAGADLLEALTRDGDPGLTAPSDPDPARLEHVRQRVLDRLAAEAARVRAPAPLPARTAGARLAGYVRDAMARAGSGLPSQTLRMADALLRALATPLAPAREEAVVRLLMELGGRSREPDGRTVDAVVSAAYETVVAHRPPDGDLETPSAAGGSPRSRAAEPVVQGVLLVTAETG
ncbi:MAG: C-terminal helicase domain-containing protein [Longimicrobiales bacterium]|nr:C-terminal helicase domain-containing protein [Longimicrobiales bacterium]